MDRRKFLSLTGTLTGGLLVVPDFLYSYASGPGLVTGPEYLVFLQLNGGNDGLNTFIPFTDDRYYAARPNIAIKKSLILPSGGGMGFHPALSGLNKIQQAGHLSVVQNVGYPQPVRSHFRSREIWQTATSSSDYANEGWLGRYLDVQCKDHFNPVGAVNVDTVENLAVRGREPNGITVGNPAIFRGNSKNHEQVFVSSGSPSLDFVRRLAGSAKDGASEIQKAMADAPPSEVLYPKTPLGKQLHWISDLIRGGLNSRIYFTSLGGFDTHDNQTALHQKGLQTLDDAVWAFYSEMKSSGLLPQVTLVIFSEFGRRVQDNGHGTDHGTAAPVFVVGGNNSGRIIGSNPDLEDLDNGDLKHKIDFRSLYASFLNQKLHFNPTQIGIREKELHGLFV